MLDMRKLEGKIKDLLIQSQYRFFVKKDYPVNPTITELREIDQEAIDYYLGRSVLGPMHMASPDEVRFRNIISLQVGNILRQIEESET